MRIAIAGAHGKIAMRLTSRLASSGETVIGLIRNPDHAEDVRAQGGEPIVCDLEQATVAEVAAAIDRCQAAVFAAGAGPGSGRERKLTMDRDGAIKLLHATTQAGVPTYLMISAVGAGDPPRGNDVFSVYLRAKAQADSALTASDHDWTIVRPGGLTDDPGTGRIRLDSAPFRGRIPRDDIAAVLDKLLHDPRASRRIMYLNSGQVPIEQALDTYLAAGSPTRPG